MCEHVSQFSIKGDLKGWILINVNHGPNKQTCKAYYSREYHSKLMCECVSMWVNYPLSQSAIEVTKI